jgi:hypothetical protein
MGAKHSGNTVLGPQNRSLEIRFGNGCGSVNLTVPETFRFRDNFYVPKSFGYGKSANIVKALPTTQRIGNCFEGHKTEGFGNIPKFKVSGLPKPNETLRFEHSFDTLKLGSRT